MFKHVVDLFIVDLMAYEGLQKLKKLPPDFLNILRALDPFKFPAPFSASMIATMSKSIYKLVRQSSFQTWFAGSRH
jgi:hypothetical protein